MQLIRTGNKTDLISDRHLWLWAAVWTIKLNIQNEIIDKGIFMGICVTCALYTGCFCDYCNGPICTVCDDDEGEDERKCALCIHNASGST
jgi:hypothetical protein